jgi:ubiquitin carboxyl-terminal hydrolase 34
MSLVVMAISDPQVAAQCPNRELQIELVSALVELFVSLLGGNCSPSLTLFSFNFSY